VGVERPGELAHHGEAEAVLAPAIRRSGPMLFFDAQPN
jgi:hypothetical protein